MSKLHHILQVSIFKTLYVNLKSFPLREAIRLPVIVGRHTTLKLAHRGIVIDGPVCPGMITFGIGGSHDLIDFESKRNYLEIRTGAKVVFRGRAHFAVHTSLLAAKNTMVFGPGFSSNNGCKFSCVEGIEFGKDCLLGGNVVVRDSDGHSVFDLSETGDILHKHPDSLPIRIGNHVWLASNVHILKGVKIADEVVVAYGAIVTKSIDDNNVMAAGIPAQIKKSSITWKL